MIREYYDTERKAYVITDGVRRIEFAQRPPAYITLETLWENPYLHGGTIVTK